jgi:NADH-quinone oxidoreductase subunit N
MITAGLFSLAGMPLLVGFFTKFILFQAIVSAGHLGLVTIAIVASTVSLYYYLMVIRQMYLYEPEEGTEQWKLSVTGYVTTLALFVSLVVFGLWGTPLYAAADAAASGMF